MILFFTWVGFLLQVDMTESDISSAFVGIKSEHMGLIVDPLEICETETSELC